VTSVAAQSPAAQADLRPGDVIVAVNGAAPFVDGVLSPGVLRSINQTYPRNRTVRLTLRRPATGRTWTVTITPAPYPASPPAATSKLLPDDVALVTLPAFFPGAADQVIQAITKLTPRGVILDLRGNRGGSGEEVNRLLGAFVHDKITAYQCDAEGTCTANRTDDTVALLNLPLVTLTDRACGSACDHFSSAVKALHLGPLVGTRTAGVVSGPAGGYQLSDNSMLVLPTLHHLGPNHEIIDGIGVPPDHYVPQTADDLSKGDDRAIATALTLIR
jgi:carboxyl-terminal processing protease